MFQSSPSPKAGSYCFCFSSTKGLFRFNPLPARRPGATRSFPALWFEEYVSILSQPEGRELRNASGLRPSSFSFQSSPSPKAGSYYHVQRPNHPVSSFNPLPARRPGATSIQSCCHVGMTSFNPLPARRPGATGADRLKSKGVTVSILSQPEGRELHHVQRPNHPVSRFQSSPSPKAGSYHGRPKQRPHHIRFNPLPARRPGATRDMQVHVFILLVSILSQPEGRELPSAILMMCCDTACFNPLPARWPVATLLLAFVILGLRCFNPLPARRPGATFFAGCIANALTVSILSQPEGRELRDYHE